MSGRPGRSAVKVAALIVTMFGGGLVAAVPAQAVAGGGPAADGTYRFVAKVQVGDARACTGVLVHPQWVLTSTNCFAENGQPVLAGPPTRPITVTIGRADLTSTSGHQLAATWVVPHPDRNVTMVKLTTAVTDITPVPLAATPPSVGQALTIAGFGRTSTEWVPDRLHTATFTVRSVATTTMDVTGASAGAAICKGDSGGPALRDNNGRTELVGLHHTSWQHGCLGESETRQGAVETRVDVIAEWIRVQGWDSLGGIGTSAPAVTSWANGRLDVFVRGTDNALWHKFYNGGWSDWESLGGILTSAPAVSSSGNGRLDVFVRGTDNDLWHKSYNGGWSDWESLGGILTSAPAASSWHNGRLDVFVRGTDNALKHKSYNGRWSDWESLGGILTSAPAAVSWGDGRIDVVVGGVDNVLWHKWYQNGWSDWESPGGILTSDPAMSSRGVGRLDVFARGQENLLWRRSYQGSWADWSPLDGYLTSAPAAVSWGPSRIDMVALGGDSAVWHTSYE